MRVADGLGYGIGGLGSFNAAGCKGPLYRARLLVVWLGGHAGRRLLRVVLGRKLIMSPTLDSALESVLWQKRVKSRRRMGRRDRYVYVRTGVIARDVDLSVLTWAPERGLREHESGERRNDGGDGEVHLCPR